MSKILLNPPIGAQISSVPINGKTYFEKPWEIDSIIKLEDDEVAEELLKKYGFLVEFTPDEAKAYKPSTFKCEKCEYRTTTQISLDKHTEEHIKEEKLEKELGIEVIGKETKKVQLEGQAVIDAQAVSDGLDLGEGLIEEKTKIKAKF